MAEPKKDLAELFDPFRTGEFTVPEQQRSARPDPGAAYLLVFEKDSSRIFRLPRHGEVRIGRSEEANLVLRDSLVSRHHARLLVADGVARLEDSGSQNGTFVNGERLVEPRALAPGDCVAMCSVGLVFHGPPRPRGFRAPLGLEALRDRVEEELERGRRYQRPFGLLALLARDGMGEAPELAERIAAQLRLIDAVGRVAFDTLAVLLPESAPEACTPVAERLVRTLSRTVPGLRAGMALYPRDGCDADTLLAGARAAAAVAAAGQVVPLAQGSHTRKIGQATVLAVDPAMVRLYELIERLARADLPVLIQGETGTGKELAATALHQGSPRKAGPLVALNCAALQESLVESELFGHERGAFSGAVASKPGLFEAADGGTLFLDEVGELSAAVQAKLLRVLETKRFARVGDTRERSVDVRVVAATNRDLEREAREGCFRQDLYFRLNVARVWLPPLRNRRLEIPILAQMFLGEACARAGRPAMSLDPEALELLARHPWPGNVRELKNLMEFLAAGLEERTVGSWDLLERLQPEAETQGRGSEAAEQSTQPSAPGAFGSLEEEVRALEWSRMRSALVASRGNKTRAASLIGMPLRTFLDKLKRYSDPGAQRRRR